MSADNAATDVSAGLAKPRPDARPQPRPGVARGPKTTRDAKAALRDHLAAQCAADPNRVPWPDEWFDETDSGQVCACKELWRHVFMSNLRSALGVTAAGNVEERSSHSVAESWIGGRDFHLIAALIGCDGVLLQAYIQRHRHDPLFLSRFDNTKRGGKPACPGR